MSTPEGIVKERRKSSHQMINKFVDERTQMLSLYSDLAAQHPFNDKAAISELLEQFCESLIDYTADAHFRLYRHLDEKRERRQNVIAIASEVYPQIVETTQSILDFNDKYDEADHELTINSLEADLSNLGEKLADRIELEDRVIEALVAGRSR